MGDSGAAQAAPKRVLVDATPDVRLYQAGRSYTVTAPATHRSFDLGSLIPRGRRNESVIHDVVLAGRFVAFAIGADSADSRSDRVYSAT